jgi:hypothetical protein
MRGVELPFGQGAVPRVQLTGLESLTATATELVGAVPPGLGLGALALAAVAVALPYARTPWLLTGLGAAMLAATLLLVPAAPALPLVAAAWLTVAVRGLMNEH